MLNLELDNVTTFSFKHLCTQITEEVQREKKMLKIIRMQFPFV